MRSIPVLILGGLLLAGCKHAEPSDKARPAGAAKSPVEQKGMPAAVDVKKPVASTPRATPVNESAGKVASVNTNLRFVVIDFGLNALPQAEQRLNVYREGQKVGEVKVSSQARNNIVAADITAGEARVGDEIRP
jgi:hypothetical protein